MDAFSVTDWIFYDVAPDNANQFGELSTMLTFPVEMAAIH
jgi:hypothetical protein